MNRRVYGYKLEGHVARLYYLWPEDRRGQSAHGIYQIRSLAMGPVVYDPPHLPDCNRGPAPRAYKLARDEVLYRGLKA